MSYTMDRVRRYLKCSPSTLSVTHSGESPITQPNSVITTVHTPQTFQSLEIQVSITYLLRTVEESKDLRHIMEIKTFTWVQTLYCCSISCSPYKKMGGKLIKIKHFCRTKKFVRTNRFQYFSSCKAEVLV